MTELEPCPFCGGSAKERAAFASGSTDKVGVYVECEGCGAWSKTEWGEEAEKKAADAWNARSERTCTDVEGGDFFRCSACGCEVMRVADGWKPLYMGEINHCPNCGAKVVSDDQA